MASRSPEQIIRDWLESNGPVRVGLEAFERTWGVERLGGRDRREIPLALARVGVRVEPSLERISRRDKVLLSLEAPPGEEVAEAEVTEPEYFDPESETAGPPRELEGAERRPDHAEPEPQRTDLGPEHAAPPAEPGTRRRRGRIWTDDPEGAPRPEPGPAALDRPKPAEPYRPGSAEPGRSEPPDAAPAGGIARVPRAGWALLASVGLMIVGSLGPWAKAVFVTEYGLDRNGALVIVAALVIAAVLGFHLYRGGRGSRLPLLSVAVAAVAAAIIASDFRDLVDDPFVGPYWGLYMAFIGSALAVGLSMALLVRRQSPSAKRNHARHPDTSA